MPGDTAAKGGSVRWVLVVVLVWAAINVSWALLAHFTLRTNAFDLSVFDYALWSLKSGDFGRVPFIGQSLFSHHFMPTLALVLVPYAAWPSPVMLILLQSASVAGAAFLLSKLAARSLPQALAIALVGTFLFSRYSNGAIVSVYYVESLEPLLVFAFVLAWQGRRWRWYWPLVVLALGCKEDMPIYVLGFAALTAFRGERRVAGYTAALAACWLALALVVAIPTSRAWDGLPRQNPFLEDRFGAEASAGDLVPAVDRLFSVESAKTVARTVLSVAGVCVFGPEWLAVAAPGALLNLAAKKSTLQAALLGHYAWPILPWVYLAAVAGGTRLARRGRHAAAILTGALVLFTLADTPLWLRFQRLADLPLAEAAAIRADLRLLPRDVSVLSMPNLIPHIPQRHAMCAIGITRAVPCQGQYVAISTTGDLWPLDLERTRGHIARYRSDPSYETVKNGPLYLFRSIVGAGPSVSKTAAERR